jgi:hypothetical protein
MAGTKTPKDFTARTVAWLQDKVGRVGDTDLSAYIDAAIKQYSADRPYETAVDLVGNGTNDLTLPSDFVDGWSELRQVEYPIDQIPEVIVDPNEAYLFRKPTGLVVRLLNDKPTALQGVRTTYTAYHSMGTDAPVVFTTISDADFPVVCALAASYSATQLALSYQQGVDPNSDAAFVDGQDRAGLIRQAAKDLRGIYDRHMGLGTPESPENGAPAQGFVDLDPKLLGTTEPLTHPRRWS